jgi:multiple sugar transport system permease protein
MIFNPTMGPMNHLMSFLGFPNLPFLTNPAWALGTIVTVEIWQWTPFVTLLMLAGLQTLPDDVYEAASLENASPWQQFWTITSRCSCRSRPPSSSSAHRELQDHGHGLRHDRRRPRTSTETLTLFAYQEGFKKFNLGYTSALSFLFLIAIVVIGLLYIAILKPHLEKRQ